MEPVSKQGLEESWALDTKTARKSNLLKSKAQSIADAASRYREKHDKKLPPAKTKVKKVKVVDKIDDLDDLIQHSKQAE